MADGLWRTIRGRRVFIENGQSLSAAIKASGKFEDYVKKKHPKEAKEIEKAVDKMFDDSKKTVKELTKEKQEHWEESISNALGGLDNLETEEDLPSYYQYRPYDRASDKVKYKVATKHTRALERKGFSEVSNNTWRSMRKDKNGVSYTVTTKFSIEKDTSNPKASATVKVSNVKKKKEA